MDSGERGDHTEACEEPGHAPLGIRRTDQRDAGSFRPDGAGRGAALPRAGLTREARQPDVLRQALGNLAQDTTPGTRVDSAVDNAVMRRFFSEASAASVTASCWSTAACGSAAS